MPTYLWNQGRVVGLSAYEIYVRQHMADKNNGDPATEVEWLASSIAMGASMLLKYGPDNDTSLHTVDIPLPSTSRLGAASTIVASLFHGDGHFEENSYWADYVEDYGILVANTSENHPTGEVTDASQVPDFVAANGSNWNRKMEDQLRSYVKIVDGVVIQPGNWVDTTLPAPGADLQPNMGQSPTVRLLIAGEIKESIQILLTGFTIRSVLTGVSGTDGSVMNQNHQDDGSFLGPAVFPWSTKIVFSVPTSAINAFLLDKYRRQLPASSDVTIVDDNAIIDMRSTDPKTYYESMHSNAAVDINVDEFHTFGEGAAVITVYQRSALYPPAIFGTYVTEEGPNNIYPLDSVAPGSIKMFSYTKNPGNMLNYETTFPGTFTMYKDEYSVTHVLNEEDEMVPIADVNRVQLSYVNPGESPDKAQGITVKTGDKSQITLAMGLEGNQYAIDSDNYTEKIVGNTSYDQGSLTRIQPSSSNIYWAAILEALANNKSIDVLGDDLKAIKSGLARPAGDYIQYPNGLRLYISPTEPTDTDVPVGSIGIGWFAETETE